jgi:hypothetical protein
MKILGLCLAVLALLALGLQFISPSKAEAVFPNDQAAYQFFISAGLTNYQAAGIVGNLDQESGDSPTAVQIGGPGRGIAQWSAGGRWDTATNDNVLWYANLQDESSTSLTLQLQFIWYELVVFPGYGLSALKASTDVSTATEAFESNFEICNPALCNTTNRISYAQAVLGAFGSNPAPAPLAQAATIDPVDPSINQVSAVDQWNGLPVVYFAGPGNSLSEDWLTFSSWNLATVMGSGVFSGPSVLYQGNGYPSAYYEGPGNSLREAWLSPSAWNLAVVETGGVYSAPSAANQGSGWPDVYYEGPNHSLKEALLSSSGWTVYTVESSGVYSSPSVLYQSNGLPSVYYEGPNSSLDEIWLTYGGWDLAVVKASGVYSSPSAVDQGNGWPAVYYEGPNSSLDEAWLSPGSWNIAVVATGGVYGGPSEVDQSDGYPSVYYEGPNNSLTEAWLSGSGWNFAGDIANNAVF